MKPILSIVLLIIIFFSMGCPPIHRDLIIPQPEIRVNYTWDNGFTFDASIENLTDTPIKESILRIGTNLGGFDIYITSEIPAFWILEGVHFEYITPDPVEYVFIEKITGHGVTYILDSIQN